MLLFIGGKMENFKELSKKNYKEKEKKYIDFWENINILKKSIIRAISLQNSIKNLTFLLLVLIRFGILILLIMIQNE